MIIPKGMEWPFYSGWNGMNPFHSSQNEMNSFHYVHNGISFHQESILASILFLPVLGAIQIAPPPPNTSVIYYTEGRAERMSCLIHPPPPCDI